MQKTTSAHRAIHRRDFGGYIAAIGNEFALLYGNPAKVRAAWSGVEGVVAGA
jgi:hypothetical protein